MKEYDPDLLLDNSNRSIMGAALIASLAIHVVLIFGTAFQLYADWHAYGMHTPATLKLLKKEKAEEERNAARGTPPPAATGDTVATEPTETTPQKKVPDEKPADTPPTAPELDPLPPKSDFTFGDDFSL